jgi:methyltransferase (TIGR00027 family)
MRPVPRFGGPALYVVVRTRFFDDFLRYPCWRIAVRQVVLLAAGMDARAFRLDWPLRTRLYELDRPEVLRAKDEILARAEARPICERRTIGADLGRSSWSQALLKAGYGTREPSVWLMEGLLFYMDESALRNLLGVAATLAALGSLLGVDLVNMDLLVSPAMRPLLATFAGRGAPGRFGVNDPEALLAECGWGEAGATQPGEWGANYGRWPYPVAPRGVAGISRIFFVQARRSARGRGRGTVWPPGRQALPTARGVALRLEEVPGLDVRVLPEEPPLRQYLRDDYRRRKEAEETLRQLVSLHAREKTSRP